MTTTSKKAAYVPEPARGFRKRRGETFGQWWQRIPMEDAMAATIASRKIGVTPQSIFLSYARYEDET